MQEKIIIEGCEFDGYKIAMGNGNFLVIKGSSGFLGCGYVNIEAADRLGDCAAIVTGVKNFEDMFSAKVVKVSRKAAESGICEGMTGQDALMKMIR